MNGTCVVEEDNESVSFALLVDSHQREKTRSWLRASVISLESKQMLPSTVDASSSTSRQIQIRTLSNGMLLQSHVDRILFDKASTSARVADSRPHFRVPSTL